MNCQDISRIADTGSISNLTSAERGAAESHARSCRDCAAIWGVQSRLAGVRVPATPPQVAARFRMLAALPEQPARGRLPRRLTLIGGLVVLAAAAAVLLTVQQAGTPVVEPLRAAAAVPVVEAVPAPVIANVVAPAVAPAAPVKKVVVQPDRPAPLLPPPYLGSLRAPAFASMESVDLALEKVVQRHPELVEGPEIVGTFVVGLTVKSDGSVLTSAVRHAPPGGVGAASAEIDALIPGDGGLSAWSRPKATRLRDGRTLRADTVLTLRSVPDGFDLTRSRARVLQILGDKYAYLMAPVSNGALNRVEVFFSDSGNILREHVDIARSDDSGTSVTEDPADVARFAEGMASRLGLDVGQIGVVGITVVSQGLMIPVFNPAGGPPTMPNTPRMLINYAWARRAAESAPTLGGTAPAQGINQTAALAVAERYVPDAFNAPDPAAGPFTVLLSARGEFIRAERLPPQTPPLSAMKMLREQMAGAVPLDRLMNVKLTNAAGVTAEVYFAWEKPKTGTASPANWR